MENNNTAGTPVITEKKDNKDYADEVKKKLLITGGNGFMGRHLAERFIHEGWDVFVVDDKTSPEMEEWETRARVYKLSVTNPDVEEIFRVNNIDVVVHMAERTTSTKDRTALDNSHVNMTGLMNMMQLSTSYQVKKFIYVSTGSVLPHDMENAPDNANADPETTRAVSKHLGEQYVKMWRRMFKLNTTIVRLSTVYGPGQLAHHGFIANFMSNATHWQTMKFYGNSNSTRDFIYVDDAMFAIYLLVVREYNELYLNISSGNPVSFNNLLKMCATFMPLPEIDYYSDDADRFKRPSLNNEKCKKELGWRQKYDTVEGLKKTYEWYAQRNEERLQRRSRQKTDLRNQAFFAVTRPYIENGILLILVLLISSLQDYSPVNSTVGFDICYLYITCMGILYGKKQSIPAVVISMIVLTWSLILHGGELVSIMYSSVNMLHYSSYLFLGVLTGYVTDNKAHQLETERYKFDRLRERYEFLENTYHDSINVKDKLYRQIVNSDDSIGFLYKIVQHLDSVEVENIFTQAAVVTRNIMDVENIAIYMMGHDGLYMRQKVRFGELTDELPRSLKVADLPFREDVIEKKQIYVNTTLMEKVPDLVAPIVYNDNVIAIIELYGMNFDQWSIYEQNLLSVTARMISMSMGRAYQYEQELVGRRFIGNTRIMQENEFRKLEKELMNRAAIQTSLKIALLEFDLQGMSYEDLDKRLGNNIRAEDIIGIVNGRVHMLLEDVPEAAIIMLMKRIEDAGIIVIKYEQLT